VCFTVEDVVDGALAEVEIVQNAPHEEGGCMRPVLTLAENNVNAIVVDGIGGRPLMGVGQVGIAVHTDMGADVCSAVEAYARGALPMVSLEGAGEH
jgi:predicted Fe-Mo cluster-binding NifX family protein